MANNRTQQPDPNYYTEAMAHDEKLPVTPWFEPEKLLPTYKAAKKRLFLFDYDGTLVRIEDDPSSAVPTPDLLESLYTLSQNPRNQVWIISGRDKAFLSMWFQNYPAMGLSAEHGCFARLPHDHEWMEFVAPEPSDWQPSAIDFFQKYVERVHGSKIEKKQATVAWHYRQANDQNTATRLADEAFRSLTDRCKGTGLAVMKGKCVVEVRPEFADKGETVRQVLQNIGETPDFIMCAGDDITDEYMFRAVNGSRADKAKRFTILVADKLRATQADWCTDHPDRIVAFLADCNDADAADA